MCVSVHPSVCYVYVCYACVYMHKCVCIVHICVVCEACYPDIFDVMINLF